MPFFRNEEDRLKKSDKVIRNHVAWSMGAGLIPIPIADVFAVSAVQLDMVKQLANTFDIDFRETEGKALITSLVGSSIARVMAGGAAKLIPGLGSVVGGGAMALLSGASTYALGEVFKEHFQTGGTFLDFDVDRLRKYYDEKFEKGKKVAKDIKKEEADRESEVESDFDAFVTEQKETTAKEETPNKEEAIKEATSTTEKGMDAVLNQLSKLAKLRDDGVITEADFQQMKKKLMDEM